jgi:WD40 repeat protein
MRKYIHLLIFIIPPTTALPCQITHQNNVIEQSIGKPQCIAFHNSNILVGGSKGCAAFDQTTQTFVQTITTHNTKRISIHPYDNTIALTLCTDDPHALEKTKGTYTLQIFDQAMKKIIFSKNYSIDEPYVLSGTKNKIFFCHKNRLKEFNYSTKTSTDYVIPWQNYINPNYTLTFNKTKNELVYQSNYNILTILQTDKLIVKDALDTKVLRRVHQYTYSTDGNTIAVRNNNTRSYLLHDLQSGNNDFKLIGNINTNYVDIAFHPFYYLVALLTDDNTIELWKYTSPTKLIAYTHPIASINERIYPQKQSQRLTFSSNGKLLACTLLHFWYAIKCPQDNLFFIYLWLLYDIFPKDLVNVITRIISTHTECPDTPFLYLDTLALSKV